MTTTPQRPEGWPSDDFVTTEELLRRRAGRPVLTVEDVGAIEDPFESDTEHDEFLAHLYESRRADLG